MAVEIIYDEGEDRAVLFCNTTGWALGPVFSTHYDNGWNLDGRESAESFLGWHQEIYGTDPRGVDQKQLEHRYGQWLAPLQENIEGEDACADCGSPYHRPTHCPERD